MERRLGSMYVLESVLGRGASGEVWRGRRDDGTPLAFKLLHQGMVDDPALVRRFVEERALLLSLQHPNLVRIHDFVVEGPNFAIVMDLNEGPDLRKVISAENTLSPAEVCRIGVAIAAGLGAIHKAGIVHRDIKPENVLLDTTKEPSLPRVTDFGIAQITDQAPTMTSSSVVGTAQYIAPEVYDGLRPTAAADMYALGIVLYELSCGVTPFADTSALTVMRRHVEHAPGRPEGVPNQLWDVIAWCLAKRPANRPQSAQQLAEALIIAESALAGLPSAPKRKTPPPSTPLRDGTRPVAHAAHAVATKPGGLNKRRAKLLAAAVAAVLLVAAGVTAVVLTTGTPTPTGTAAADTAGSLGRESTPTTTAASRTSDAPLMPNVVGSTVTEARAELPSGTEITIVEVAAPTGTPNGVVIDQDPGPGGDLPEKVTLTVATSQASTFLVDLSYVTGDISTLTDVLFNGVPQLNAVGDRLYTCNGDTGSVQYNLGRNYTSFAAVAGIDDTSVDALTQVTVEVLGDQRSLATVAVPFGSPQELIVDTTGVLRLELRWSVTGFSSDNCGDSYIAFGNARLIAKPGYEPPTPTD